MQVHFVLALLHNLRYMYCIAKQEHNMRRHPQLKSGKQLGYVIYDRTTMEVLSPVSFTPYVYPFEHHMPPRFLNQGLARAAIQRFYSDRPDLAVTAFANYVDHQQKQTGIVITQDLY
jgi:hypothetical protein